MYILLYLEFYAPTFTSAKILRAAELFPSSSEYIFGSLYQIQLTVVLRTSAVVIRCLCSPLGVLGVPLPSFFNSNTTDAHRFQSEGAHGNTE